MKHICVGTAGGRHLLHLPDVAGAAQAAVQDALLQCANSDALASQFAACCHLLMEPGRAAALHQPPAAAADASTGGLWPVCESMRL